MFHPLRDFFAARSNFGDFRCHGAVIRQLHWQMAPIHELWYCVRNSPTKSGCKILNLPGNYPILNNKCHQQNIFTPLPSPNPTNPEIGLFWPNGTVFSHFRSVLAATRPEKFIIFAGDIRFVAGRCLLLGIIPHCYIHSANNGRSTITHI